MSSSPGHVFWEVPHRKESLSGREWETLLIRSLEENAFSMAGLDIQKANHAARVLQAQAAAPSPQGGRQSTTPSALAVGENELSEKKAEVVAGVRDIVHEMGFTLAADAAPAAPAQQGPATVGAETKASPDAPPLQVQQQGLHEDGASATTHSAHLPATSPTPASAARAPTSALAMLVARAKASQLRASDGDRAAPQGPSVTITPASPQQRHTQAASPPQAESAATLKRPRASAAASLPAGSGRAGDKSGDEKEGGDEDSFAVRLPPGVEPSSSSSGKVAASSPPPADIAGGPAADAAMKHPSQMTREEFLGQYKRAPRRGEVGQSAEEIAKAQQLGYVMSGSRSIGAQMYVDRIQRQLHEREAGKLQQQFRKVEDERMDDQMIQGMLRVLEEKIHGAQRK